MGNSKGSVVALLPLVVFLGVYVLGSLLAGDFYKMPIVVAGMAAAIVAVAMTRRITISERIGVFSRGATDVNIMWMIWIFILAGAFSGSTKAMGAVDATVTLILNAVPSEFLPAGLFLAACFTALSIGTSVGTIVALTPIAASIAEQTPDCSIGWMVSIIVGGALFGDNLSFISDTTIAATRTQGCSMRDKFRTNLLIVAPAALATLLIYIFATEHDFTTAATTSSAPWYIVLPYLLVLVSAFMGMNVLSVLVLGIFSSGIIGLACGQITLVEWFMAMGDGIGSMGDLIIITMMAGGMLEMIRYNGGIDFIITAITSRTKSRRGAEFSIAALVSFADVCTANNTVAIISVGPIVRDIATRFGISARRAASIMDTFSCFVQGLLPYGAQLLMAAGIATTASSVVISPLEIIPTLYYPMIMGGCALMAILLQVPRYNK